MVRYFMPKEFDHYSISNKAFFGRRQLEEIVEHLPLTFTIEPEDELGVLLPRILVVEHSLTIIQLHPLTGMRIDHYELDKGSKKIFRPSLVHFANFSRKGDYFSDSYSFNPKKLGLSGLPYNQRLVLEIYQTWP